MSAFASHPCFARKGSGIFTIGAACVRLSDALVGIPQAVEARQALGDPFSSERSAKALRILSALPPKVQAKILTAERRSRKDV